jgi:hypothetical protein
MAAKKSAGGSKATGVAKDAATKKTATMYLSSGRLVGPLALGTDGALYGATDQGVLQAYG